MSDTYVLPTLGTITEAFISFDIAGPGLESVDVRPSQVVAVETDAAHPGTCVLRLHPSLYYRVDGEPDDVIAQLLGASDD